MTIDEARQVAAIISTADNGCRHCVAALVQLARVNFTEFNWYYEPIVHSLAPVLVTPKRDT